jgi:putative SOS response-associated peptidase YedK
MCGRYKMTQHPMVPEIFRRIGVTLPEDGWVPRWNIGPMQRSLVVAAEAGNRSLETMRWGFVPAYERAAKPKLRPINARAETLRSSGMFRQSFAARRCLVPATGFYEWEGPSDARLPCLFERDGAPFWLAGIWSRWQPDAATPPELTFALVTQGAWAPVARIHDRSPVVIEEEDREVWLGPDAELAFGLIRPPRLPFTERRVSARVNNVRNEGPELDASDG